MHYCPLTLTGAPDEPRHIPSWADCITQGFLAAAEINARSAHRYHQPTLTKRERKVCQGWTGISITRAQADCWAVLMAAQDNGIKFNLHQFGYDFGWRIYHSRNGLPDGFAASTEWFSRDFLHTKSVSLGRLFAEYHRAKLKLI